MAQTLEWFEEHIEPLIPSERAQEFKALVRRKMNALATDASELLELSDGDKVENELATDIKDRLYPDGAPKRG